MATHAKTGRGADKEMRDAEMGKTKALQRQYSRQAQKMRKAYLEGNISATEFGARAG